MANQGKIGVMNSNDVVFVTWQYEQAIPNCLGFTVRRKDMANTAGGFVALPAWGGWQGGSKADWKPQTPHVWAAQKVPVARFHGQGRQQLSIPGHPHDWNAEFSAAPE